MPVDGQQVRVEGAQGAHVGLDLGQVGLQAVHVAVQSGAEVGVQRVELALDVVHRGLQAVHVPVDGSEVGVECPQRCNRSSIRTALQGAEGDAHHGATCGRGQEDGTRGVAHRLAVQHQRPGVGIGQPVVRGDRGPVNAGKSHLARVGLEADGDPLPELREDHLSGDVGQAEGDGLDVTLGVIGKQGSGHLRSLHQVQPKSWPCLMNRHPISTASTPSRLPSG